MRRELTKGENELISIALFYYSQRLHDQARHYDLTAAKIEERFGDESKGIQECKENARAFRASAISASNLDRFAKRYGFSVDAPLILPEQA